MHTRHPLTINLIGAGRLGSHLAVAFKPQAIYARQLMQAQQLQTLSGGTSLITDQLSALPPADLTLIAVSDDAIATIAAQLPPLPQQHYVHCCGARSSALLAPLGPYTASIHPFRSFAPLHQKPHATHAFDGCYCFVEGHPDTVSLLNTLFEPLNAHIIPVSSNPKPATQLAGVCASNYLIALAVMARHILPTVPAPIAQAAICDIMQQTLERIDPNIPFEHAITGPLARGDTQTIQRHLTELSDDDKTVYCALAQSMLTWLPLDAARKEALTTLCQLPNFPS